VSSPQPSRRTMRSFLALACALVGTDGLLPSALTQPCTSCNARSATSMKVFDWAVRGTPPPELTTIDLSNLKPSPGSHQKAKRKGRGVSAGQGVTCGFGNRGQKSRAGSGTRPGFEGGQIPLYRRLPKFVGRPTGPGHTKTEYQIIKLSALNGMAEGSEVDFDTLLKARAVSKSKYSINKVVGSPEPLSVKGLTVKAHAFTASAQAAIEEMGGKCVELSQTTHKPLGEEPAAEEPAAEEPAAEAA